ncbi:MAG: adenylate/guanylate cyclase domain-containing protein [Acidobacteria bacterium]|nr:adenylate/guanylate cyclase domain-containing protein [Acidobacteriota bacterium]
MAKLTASERAKLPDSAFAYVDSTGKRRLPINDESHVRNALSRFDQVHFESDATRERSRTRLLNAAKKYGLVPVGFITGQLESERKLGAASTESAALPSGLVTLLFTDIEGSTHLLHQLGDGYAEVLAGVRETIRDSVLAAGGRQVEVRADESFAVFERVDAALEAAVALQRALGEHRWPESLDVRVRVGIHTGDITMTSSGYIGLPVHAASRLCSAGHGGQILLSGRTKSAAEESQPYGIEFRSLGNHQLRGLPRPEQIFQVEANGLITDFPPLRVSAAAPAS